MGMIHLIMNRHTVRHYTDQSISEEDLRTILKAGMSGPSCSNCRDWIFIVVTDPDMLNQMADANGRPAEPLRRTQVAILACGDLERAYARAKDYWIIDVSIAVQNMTLAAQTLGIGSAWLGTWPLPDRVQKQAELFGLPEHIVPHSILTLGYPMEGEPTRERPEWEEGRVHFGKWTEAEQDASKHTPV